MMIFASSDIHGNMARLEKMVEYINKNKDIKKFILCGDLFNDYNYSVQNRQHNEYIHMKTILGELRWASPLYILGNHDRDNVIESDDECYLGTGRLDEKFIGLEYINMMFINSRREFCEKQINFELESMNIKNKIDCRSIVVSHVPPYGILDTGLDGFGNQRNYGSKALVNLYNETKPRLVIFGHVHDSFGVKKAGEVTYVNCSCIQGVDRGYLIDSDALECREIKLVCI